MAELEFHKKEYSLENTIKIDRTLVFMYDNISRNVFKYIQISDLILMTIEDEL